MISYEEAKEKAIHLKENITKCVEYTDAYIFSSQEDEYSFGGDGPVVIMKEDGYATHMVAYTDELADKNSELIRKFNI